MKKKQLTTAVFKPSSELTLTREEKDTNRFYTIKDSDYILQINEDLLTFECDTDKERHYLSKEMLDNLVHTLRTINIKFILVLTISLYDDDMNFDPVYDTKESTEPSFISWYNNNRDSVWENMARLKIITPSGLITVFPSGAISFPDMSVDTKFDIIYNLALTWNNLLFPLDINRKTTSFLPTNLK